MLRSDIVKLIELYVKLHSTGYIPKTQRYMHIT